MCAGKKRIRIKLNTLSTKYASEFVNDIISIMSLRRSGRWQVSCGSCRSVLLPSVRYFLLFSSSTFSFQQVSLWFCPRSCVYWSNAFVLITAASHFLEWLLFFSFFFRTPIVVLWFFCGSLFIFGSQGPTLTAVWERWGGDEWWRNVWHDGCLEPMPWKTWFRFTPNELAGRALNKDLDIFAKLTAKVTSNRTFAIHLQWHGATSITLVLEHKTMALHCASKLSTLRAKVLHRDFLIDPIFSNVAVNLFPARWARCLLDVRKDNKTSHAELCVWT